ncbi:MAG: response regulator [Cyclobacteriaceae bacterium]|nr:response regulator [Cyclobacteriaceae bacterium]
MELYLVEDDEVYSEFISKSLSHKAYSVKPFYSAEDCLGAMQSLQPDAILIDYKLPGMNGIEFYEKIKNEIDEDKIKIILLSSIDDGNLVLDFIQKGIRDYVVKDEHVIDSLISIIEGKEDDYYFFDE